MKNFLKKISLALSIAIILSALASCTTSHVIDGTEEATLESLFESTVDEIIEGESSENVTDEPAEEETYETELVDELISFVDYTRTGRSYHNLKTGGNAAMSFTIPEGQLKKLYLNITDKHGYTDCSVMVNIYSFTGNYRSTLDTEPIFSEYITRSLRTYTLEFEDGQMPAGDYLVVLSYVEPVTEEESDSIESSTEVSESGNTTTEAEKEYHCQVVQDVFWYEKTLPEGYEKYDLRSYIKDKSNKKNAFCGGMVVEVPVVKEETETDVDTDDNNGKYPDDTAKVILLGGQSNATGATVGSFLRANVGDEKYQEYLNGYSNVKIYYNSGTLVNGIPTVRNRSQEFVDVKLGQGISAGTYGPELGLAAYLSEAFPDETFYIIKYAIGSSGLYSHWNPTDEEKDQCLVEFKETVETGLDLLEAEGLDPRIVAFVWMQGESDASTAFRAHEYYELQKALVEHIRDEYAFYEGIGGIAFVDATITASGVWGTFFIVNDCKMRYAEESPLNFCVDTNLNGLDTLVENNDPAHYDSTSMILLGELYGMEIAKLFK